MPYCYRGRHASKVTEEEEDEVYLKEEEDSLTGAGGGTRLVSQPSCKLSSVWYFRCDMVDISSFSRND